MKKLTLITMVILMVTGLFPLAANAAMKASYDDVRLMLTAPDNQTFDMWDQDSLVGVLMDIIENDPVDAMYHERVISSALKVLGSMNVPEAVPVLIEHLDDYTTTCLYWLGTYDDADAVGAIVEYLDDENASVRCEAATALGTVPVVEAAPGVEVDEEFEEQVSHALAILNERLEVETDADVIEALNLAIEHLS